MLTGRQKRKSRKMTNKLIAELKKAQLESGGAVLLTQQQRDLLKEQGILFGDK